MPPVIPEFPKKRSSVFSKPDQGTENRDQGTMERLNACLRAQVRFTRPHQPRNVGCPRVPGNASLNGSHSACERFSSDPQPV